MRKDRTNIWFGMCAATLMVSFIFMMPSFKTSAIQPQADINPVESDVVEVTVVPVETPSATPIISASPEPTPEEIEIVYPLSDEEIDFVAQLTMAEAEGEPEEGQRLVIDVVLNRVDSSYFPDTVYDVVYQKNQFTCMWNGRFDRCYPRDDLVELVKEELLSRTNTEVVFFRTQRYSSYGVPVMQVGHHYFSSYN